MSTQLRFDLAAALRLAEHTIAAPHKQPSFTEDEAGTGCPGALVWSNDHGVYLMSGGRPGLYNDPDNHDRGHVVVYAEGYRPDDQWYDPTLGGDDFAEHIHLTGDDGSDPTLIELLREAATGGYRWLILNVSADTYSIGVA
jgi:hypothetical protein